MHYIITPPVYDHPGQLIHPLDYARRFRGATAIVEFGITHFQWANKNTFELAYLRVLVTPSPRTPVTPRFKRSMVLRHDQKFVITQPDFKRAKLDDNKGIPAPADFRE